MNQKKFTFIAILAFGLSLTGCSSTPDFDQYPKKVEPTPTPKKPKEKPPEKKPEFIWKCKISNNAGLTFMGDGETAYQAQVKARRVCERTNRNCSLLGCKEEEVQE